MGETTSASLFPNKYMAALKRKYLVDLDILHFFYSMSLRQASGLIIEWRQTKTYSKYGVHISKIVY